MSKLSLALIISTLGFVCMFGVISWAFLVGDFGVEGSKIISLPWGIVSLVDLYTGFILFSLWVWFREGSTIKSGLWTMAMMVFGFLAGSAYVLLLLLETKGDWHCFFLGKHILKDKPADD